MLPTSTFSCSILLVAIRLNRKSSRCFFSSWWLKTAFFSLTVFLFKRFIFQLLNFLFFIFSQSSNFLTLVFNRWGLEHSNLPLCLFSNFQILDCPIVDLQIFPISSSLSVVKSRTKTFIRKAQRWWIVQELKRNIQFSKILFSREKLIYISFLLSLLYILISTNFKWFEL